MRNDMQVSKPRNKISTNISISVNPRKMTPMNENDKQVYRYIKYVFFELYFGVTVVFCVTFLSQSNVNDVIITVTQYSFVTYFCHGATNTKA
jgi:multidrug efflux pump subunit AcrB